MPEESEALRYVKACFTHVQPYVPVLDKAVFYRQWHNNREFISPLILEAIFALGSRLEGEPSKERTWLALATRTSFL